MQRLFFRDTEAMGPEFEALIDLARLYQRSAYDASYLEVARRRGLPLATKDEPQRKAAESAGISIFRP